MKIHKILIVIAIVLAACLMALGFNTLDWMTQVAGQPALWHFIYGSNLLCVPFWYAYFFGGILPLTCGGLLIGMVTGYILKGRKRKGVKP